MRVFSVLLLAGLAAGCVRTSTNPATGSVDVDVESPTKQGERWTTNLAGQGSYSAVTGSATADVVEGATTATITLQGGQANAEHPWHIHEGTCSTGGPIVGSPSDYPPLQVGSEGRAQGGAKVNARLDEAKEYHVNVHLSRSEMGTIVACGQLDD